MRRKKCTVKDPVDVTNRGVIRKCKGGERNIPVLKYEADISSSKMAACMYWLI